MIRRNVRRGAASPVLRESSRGKTEPKSQELAAASQPEQENKKREQKTTVPSFRKAKVSGRTPCQGKRNVTEEREPGITGQSRQPSRKRTKALAAAHKRI